MLYTLLQETEYAWSVKEQLTKVVFLIQNEEGLQGPPKDIGIIIEGVEVLHFLTPVALVACALLLSLIYALNLA